MATLGLTALLAYLLGSVPFGLLLTRAAGLGDIRQVGSGNIGATNVLRTGRRGLAAATLLLDAAKGAAAVLLAEWLFASRDVLAAGSVTQAVVAGIAAAFAVIGHCLPVWLGFRGGKGVATGLGVVLAVDWRIGIACCAVWLVVAALTRRSSAAALAAIVLAPVLGGALQPWSCWMALVFVAVFVVARHRANIGRLVAGTEPRIGRG